MYSWTQFQIRFYFKHKTIFLEFDLPLSRLLPGVSISSYGSSNCFSFPLTFNCCILSVLTNVLQHVQYIHVHVFY